MQVSWPSEALGDFPIKDWSCTTGVIKIPFLLNTECYQGNHQLGGMCLLKKYQQQYLDPDSEESLAI